jgi:hypothetical protein
MIRIIYTLKLIHWKTSIGTVINYCFFYFRLSENEIFERKNNIENNTLNKYETVILKFKTKIKA